MNKIFKTAIIFTGALSCHILSADSGTPAAAPNGSDIQTQLRLEIKDDTKEVHLINTNNDPYVHTKTYVLKHADPYEIRPFIREAVQSKRVDSNQTKVECIKYNDGTGILIVSAEKYRFEKKEGIMSIDEVVEMLDKPEIISEEDFKTFVYFPKYWDSTSLRQLVSNVGANVQNDAAELDSGEDLFSSDESLNALLFYVAPYSKKNIEKMLELYDTPTTEVSITYTVYEVDAENDGKVGADFQAWKNGEGSRLLSLGGRHRNGWNAAYGGGINKSKSSAMDFLNMSPKWNTRFLDFLIAKSHAKVVTSGKLDIMNSQTGTITKTTDILRFADGTSIADQQIIGYVTYNGTSFVTSGTAAAAGNVDSIRIQAFDSEGTQIDFDAGFTGDLIIAQITTGEVTSYMMHITTPGAGNFVKNGKNMGKKATAFALTLQTSTESFSADNRTAGAGNSVYSFNDTTPTYSDTYNIGRDVQRNVVGAGSASEISGLNGYGFRMQITPVVCEESTIMDISMRNDSLVGFDDDGTPRITRNSSVDTRVMMSNSGKEFVIGGLEKRTVVDSVAKLPYLGDIPGLGWLLGSTSQTTKKSQLVVVFRCEPVTPTTAVASGQLEDIMKVKTKTKEAGGEKWYGNYNNYGFDQFLLDANKTFDSLSLP